MFIYFYFFDHVENSPEEFLKLRLDSTNYAGIIHTAPLSVSLSKYQLFFFLIVNPHNER